MILIQSSEVGYRSIASMYPESAAVTTMWDLSRCGGSHRVALGDEPGAYGPDGFFVRGERHPFRTSAAASPCFARAILSLLSAVDAALDHPADLRVVDVGAGHGELLPRLLALARRTSPRGCARSRSSSRRAPPDVPDRIEWRPDLPPPGPGLLHRHRVARQRAPRHRRRRKLSARGSGHRRPSRPAAALTTRTRRGPPVVARRPRVELGGPRDAPGHRRSRPSPEDWPSRRLWTCGGPPAAAGHADRVPCGTLRRGGAPTVPATSPRTVAVDAVRRGVNARPGARPYS
jgi:hypothetical protein